MFIIDKIGRTWKHLCNKEDSILKTCPRCFTCFYGDINVELEKCDNCKEIDNG